MRKKRIYITGISGTGKTTIADQLNKEGVRAFSIDEVDNLCFWINKKTGKKVTDKAELNSEFIKAHSWICNPEKIKEILNTNDNPIVVLGMADNQKDFIGLFDKVLLLQCRPEVFLQRIKNRHDNDFGKDKTAQKFILGIYKDFENTMLNEGAIPVDAGKPIKNVVTQILEYINKE